MNKKLYLHEITIKIYVKSYLNLRNLLWGLYYQVSFPYYWRDLKFIQIVIFPEYKITTIISLALSCHTVHNHGSSTLKPFFFYQLAYSLRHYERYSSGKILLYQPPIFSSKSCCLSKCCNMFPITVRADDTLILPSHQAAWEHMEFKFPLLCF